MLLFSTERFDDGRPHGVVVRFIEKWGGCTRTKLGGLTTDRMAIGLWTTTCILNIPKHFCLPPPPIVPLLSRLCGIFCYPEFQNDTAAY